MGLGNHMKVNIKSRLAICKEEGTKATITGSSEYRLLLHLLTKLKNCIFSSIKFILLDLSPNHINYFFTYDIICFPQPPQHIRSCIGKKFSVTFVY